MKSRWSKIIIHILGSLAFLSVPVVFSPDFDLSFRLVEVGGFRRDMLAYLLLIAVFYAHYYRFIPKFFHTKEYLIYGLTVVLCFGLVVGVPLLVRGKPPLHATGQQIEAPPRDIPRRDGPPLLHAMEQNIVRFAMVISIAMLLSIYERLRKTERAKVEAELSYLKAQINPHFLFNTLNSIYSLAITRSEHAPAAVQKLSAMMRYVTTEAHNDRVPLQKEMDYVSNYVELQRIRLGQTVRIEYNVKGEAGTKQIAPLIMIPYVENAFKYGVNPEEDSFIQIHITIEHDRLTFLVRNKIVRIDFSDEYKSGHGMENASHRLKMGYPGKHKLNSGRFDNEYIINLEIEL
jgi:two-component sensor histidine kinase